MRRIVLSLLVLLGVALALAFWQAREPRSEGGAFDLAGFFEGRSVSTGMITTALVKRERFTASFTGERLEDAFRLEERFRFEDGERLQVWRLTPAANGFEGTVETEGRDGALFPPVPVTGIANEDGVVLEYEGYAPGGRGRLLHFRHHMRAQADGTLANHVVVSKFAVPLATSTVVFTREAGALPSPTPGR